MNPKEKEIVAYHESGHAIVAESRPTCRPGAQDLHHPPRDRGPGLHPAAAHRGPVPDDPVGAARPDGGAPGRTGGRGTGLRGDLHRGAERPAAGHGYRPVHGDGIRHERTPGPGHLRAGAPPHVPPGQLPPGSKTYSEEKAAEIDEEISKVVEDTHQRVRKILGGKREVLNTLAKLLLEKEVVQGDEMRALLGKSSRPSGPARGSQERVYRRNSQRLSPAARRQRFSGLSRRRLR